MNRDPALPGDNFAPGRPAWAKISRAAEGALRSFRDELAQDLSADQWRRAAGMIGPLTRRVVERLMPADTDFSREARELFSVPPPGPSQDDELVAVGCVFFRAALDVLHAVLQSVQTGCAYDFSWQEDDPCGAGEEPRLSKGVVRACAEGDGPLAAFVARHAADFLGARAPWPSLAAWAGRCVGLFRRLGNEAHRIGIAGPHFGGEPVGHVGGILVGSGR